MLLKWSRRVTCWATDIRIHLPAFIDVWHRRIFCCRDNGCSDCNHLHLFLEDAKRNEGCWKTLSTYSTSSTTSPCNSSWRNERPTRSSHEISAETWSGDLVQL